jgi:hypothetical protein
MVELKPLPTDEILTAAWYSQDSTRTITIDLGISGNKLEAAWRRLKREGKLPLEPRQVGRPQPPITDHDGRPSVDGKWFGDPLLAELTEKHGNDNETGVRADIYPGLKVRR